jgi:hypothetical protein
MKKLFILIFLSIIFIISCSDSKEQKERFIKTYKEILIARERFSDTAIANTEVRKAFRRHNYSEQTFFEDWQHYTSNPKEFLVMMDTIRSRAQKEVERLEKK